MYILLVGSINEGLQAIGPFETVQEASDFSDSVDTYTEVLKLEGTDED